MIPRKSGWERALDTRGIEIYGVRILGRVSFICIVVSAWAMNEADQAARAKGLLSFRVDIPMAGLGTHACMQPEAQEIEPEPEPKLKEPPCPRSSHVKGANSSN